MPLLYSGDLFMQFQLSNLIHPLMHKTTGFCLKQDKFFFYASNNQLKTENN